MDAPAQSPALRLDRIPVTSIYVWGEARAPTNGIARRVAERLDPKFTWVEAESSLELSAPTRAGSDHGTFVSPGSLSSESPVSEERFWSYLRPKGQHAVGRDVLEFVRMPDVLQTAILSLLEREPPRVLVLASLDRLLGGGMGAASRLGRYIEFLNAREVTLVAASTGRPGPERIDFDYSLTLPESLPADVRPLTAVCQWGECDRCVVENVFSPAEIVCIARLEPKRPVALGNGRWPAGFASH